jgi:hypothetical protein
VRIPEKFRPAGWTPGSKNEDLVSHIDITATSLALCGIGRPDNMQGQVFIGPEAAPARDVQFCARDRADETVDKIRAARTQQYKYIRNYLPERPYTQPNNYKDTSYPPLMLMRQLKAEDKLGRDQQAFMADERPEEELYDLHADPYELRNLALEPQYQVKLGEMRDLLDGWIEETGDTGAELEENLPDEYGLRTKAGGWMTANGHISEGDSAVEMKWLGRSSVVKLPWVSEAGDYTVKMRARTKDAVPQKLAWSTVDNMRARGNEVPIEMEANGRWQDLELSFTASDWFCGLALDFGEAEGLFELQSVEILRDGETVKSWDYA